MSESNRRDAVPLALLAAAIAVAYVTASAPRWLQSLRELAGHPAAVSLAGALLIFACAVLVARLVVTRRALDHRVALLAIPADSFDPSPESVSFLERPGGHAGLIVVRSFSKIFGLAGLRVGYAITSPRLASQMTQHALPLGVSAIAAVAARAALDDREHIQASARRNADDRQEFFNSAGARMVRVIDSQANFVMINTGRSAAGVIEHFAGHGIQLPGVIAKYDEYIRVSIGAAPEMNEFWRVWDLQPGIHSHG